MLGHVVCVCSRTPGRATDTPVLAAADTPAQAVASTPGRRRRVYRTRWRPLDRARRRNVYRTRRRALDRSWRWHVDRTGWRPLYRTVRQPVPQQPTADAASARLLAESWQAHIADQIEARIGDGI